MRSSEGLTRWPLVDSPFGRTDKTNRNNMRSCNACGTERRGHRLRGVQGAGSPPFPEVGQRHATLSAIELDLGDGYLALLGYFSGEEFMEEARERPFGEAT